MKQGVLWMLLACGLSLGGWFWTVRGEGKVWSSALEKAASGVSVWEASVRQQTAAVRGLTQEVLARAEWKALPVAGVDAPAVSGVVREASEQPSLPVFSLDPLLADFEQLIGLSVWDMTKGVQLFSAGDAGSEKPEGGWVDAVLEKGGVDARMVYDVSKRRSFWVSVGALSERPGWVCVLKSAVGTLPVLSGVSGVVLDRAVLVQGVLPVDVPFVEGSAASFVFKQQAAKASFFGKVFDWPLWFVPKSHVGVGFYPVKAFFEAGFSGWIWSDTRVFYNRLATLQCVWVLFSCVLSVLGWALAGRWKKKQAHTAWKARDIENEPTFVERPRAEVAPVSEAEEPMRQAPAAFVAESVVSETPSFLEEPTTKITPLQGSDGVQTIRLEGEESVKEDLKETYRKVFDAFVQARATCGEVGVLSFERFAMRLLESKKAVMSKHPCVDVVFEVYIKEGKAALKAVPVRGNVS